MTPLNDIPRVSLDIRYNNRGLFPHVGIHRRNGLFRQESSYSHFWFFGVMGTVAAIVLLLPWETASAFGELKLKYLIAGGCVFGGLFGLLPYFIRNAFGQLITIDPEAKTLRILSGQFSGLISWNDIIGLQICCQENDGGFQLNLVWMGEGGTVRRHCLLKHWRRAFVVRLGSQYEALFGFPFSRHCH